METIIAAIISSVATLIAVLISTKKRYKKQVSDISGLIEDRKIKKITISLMDESEEKLFISKASEDKNLLIRENNLKFNIEFGNKKDLNIENMNMLKRYAELIDKGLKCR